MLGRAPQRRIGPPPQVAVGQNRSRDARQYIPYCRLAGRPPDSRRPALGGLADGDRGAAARRCGAGAGADGAAPARRRQPVRDAGAGLARVAITKLITFTPANAGTGRATIQGDVVVFDVATGERRLILHGPTVTARRTAAVSLLAAQRLAPNLTGPSAGGGRRRAGPAHLEAFADRDWACARSMIAHAAKPALPRAGPARAGAGPAAAGGERCQCRDGRMPAGGDLHARQRRWCCTRRPARRCVHLLPWGPSRRRWWNCRRGCAGTCLRKLGTVVVDTPDARHEAGDLLQAGLDVAGIASLADVVGGKKALRCRARCCSRAAAGPGGTWQRRGWPCGRN
jgi:1-piperideine-2-carboxylate/1-pyrroline-2-carboxylate reductase [NAD(P)H]